MNDESRKFLKAYFGDDLTGVYVCDSTNWQPKPAATAKLNPNAGWYWCPARLSGLDAKGQRVVANAVSVHALVIDDVGTAAVTLAEFKWAVGAETPTTMLETSKDRFHAGYAIPGGVSPADWQALRARVPWVVDGTDCVHWWRLPGGINQKPENKGFRLGAPVYGTGGLGWLPKEPRYKVRAPKARKGPQPAPSPDAVRAILKHLDLKWDGKPDSGLRDEWVADLIGIKGALLEWPVEAYEIGRDFSGPDEGDFDRVWDSIDPKSAGWGSLEIRAKEKAASAMAGEAFDDGAGAPAAGAATGHPLVIDQTVVAQWISTRFHDTLRRNVDHGRWMEFDGMRWKVMHHDRGFELSREWAGMILDRKAAASATFHTGVEKMLRNNRWMLARETDFDADPWKAGVPSGTLDLRTGAVRAARAGDMISKQMAVDPAPTEACPRWLKFIREVSRGDAEVMFFLQQWAGYCLTGDASAEKLLFIYGPGGNGKSKYVDTLREMLGEYGVQGSREVFVRRAHSGHSTVIAKMAGSRMVTMSEVPADAQWDEALLKDASGGGTMSGRFMRQDEFTFPITFKLTGYGNHKPTFAGGVGPAIQRRFLFCEFLFVPKVADPALAAAFKAEMPGIMRWALNGLASWQSMGLTVPASMTAAAHAYFAEVDPIERWLAERCEKVPGAKTTTTDLFRSFTEWRIANREHGFETINAFGTAMRDGKGLTPYRDMNGRGFKDLSIKGGMTGAAFDDERKG